MRLVGPVLPVMWQERLTGRSWEEWDYKLSLLAEGTRKNYLIAFRKFLEHYDLDTEQLYNMHNENLKSDDPRDARQVPRMVALQMKNLIDSGELKSSTANHIYDAVNSFVSANSLPLDMNGEKPQVIREGKERMTREQIQMLLDATGNYRNKSIITMLKDTGLRESDIVQIRVKHVLPVIKDKGLEFHTFSIRQEKTKQKADPVIGPDAIKYLRLWWEQRHTFGLGESPNDYVYCLVEDKPASTNKRGIKRRAVKAGDPLTPHTIANMVYHLVRKAGLKDYNISAHSLRKTHETQLAAGGVPESWIDKMTGRKTPGSRGVYVKPEPVQLIEKYRKAYSYLSISGASAKELNELRMELSITEDRLGESEENARIARKLATTMLESGEDKDQKVRRLERELEETRSEMNKRLNDIYKLLQTEDKIIGIDINLDEIDDQEE